MPKCQAHSKTYLEIYDLPGHNIESKIVCDSTEAHVASELLKICRGKMTHFKNLICIINDDIIKPSAQKRKLCRHHPSSTFCQTTHK